MTGRTDIRDPIDIEIQPAELTELPAADASLAGAQLWATQATAQLQGSADAGQ